MWKLYASSQRVDSGNVVIKVYLAKVVQLTLKKVTWTERDVLPKTAIIAGSS